MVNASLCALYSASACSPGGSPAAVTRPFRPRKSASSHLPFRHRPFLVSGLPLDADFRLLARLALVVAASARSMQEARPGDRPASPARPWPGDECPGVILSPPVPLCGAGDPRTLTCTFADATALYQPVCRNEPAGGEKRMKPRVNLVRLFAFGMIGLTWAGISDAAGLDYPTPPVRWVVGYPPGGTTDILARIIGQLSVGEARPAVHHREQARRRQQYRRPRP